MELRNILTEYVKNPRLVYMRRYWTSRLPMDLRGKIESLVSKEPMSGCWLWIGSTSSLGYGHVFDSNNPKVKFLSAHRASYEAFRGPIPEGLTLDHLCRVRCCVNPWHLEPVTQAENVYRGIGLTARHHRKTHCDKGHPLAGHNLALTPARYNKNNMIRVCLTCRRARQSGYAREARAYIRLLKTV